MVNLWTFIFGFVCLLAFTASGNVLVIGNNVTLSLEDIEAHFAPSLKGSGICGTVYLAEPLDACKPLTNEVEPEGDVTRSPFVLIIRGGCSFQDKVRRAQAAGFKAAIIYDNEYGDLIAMAGNSAGIKKPAVFVSRASGEMLSKYGGITGVEVWIIPSFESSAWSIMAISFISLLAMSAVLATCFFFRRHRIRRELPRASLVREFHGMSGRLVKAMPSLIFTAVLEDNCTSSTCAICLEDYNVGEKLRILPCSHKFHAVCVDAWLTSWRTFCPVCKRDARTSGMGDPSASEATPLLSSAGLSSFRLSSSTIQIGHPAASWRSPSVVDCARYASSQRSGASSSYMGRGSPHSIGYPCVSPLNSRNMMMTGYVRSPGCMGSPSRQPNASLLNCSESAASFSAFASAQPLPGVN